MTYEDRQGLLNPGLIRNKVHDADRQIVDDEVGNLSEVVKGIRGRGMKRLAVDESRETEICFWGLSAFICVHPWPYFLGIRPSPLLQLPPRIHLPDTLHRLAAQPIHPLVQIHRYTNVIRDDMHALADAKLAAGLRQIHKPVLLIHLMKPRAGSFDEMAKCHIR